MSKVYGSDAVTECTERDRQRAHEIERERNTRHTPSREKRDNEGKHTKQKMYLTDRKKDSKRPGSQFGDSRHRKFREYEVVHHFHSYQAR